MAYESQVPGWMYNQVKKSNPHLDQSGIEQTARNQMGLGDTQSTSSFGGPIMAYGYQNPNGPGPLGGGGGGSGSGSSGPTGPASDWYNGVMKGDNLPYSPFAIKNLQSQATDMNAAGENARNDQMTSQAAASGASAGDPSLQGAKLNSMARRQTDNAQAVNDIQSKANQANFSAQAEAAAHMTQTKLAYDEMANGNAMRYSPFSGNGGSGGRAKPAQSSNGFWQPQGNDYQPISKNDRQSNGFWAGPPGQRRPPGTVN